MARVALRQVVKRYGAVEAIRGLSIDIDDGEFVTLVGPSGCGKSTLLRIVAGLEEITQGEIVIDGAVVNDKAPKERDIAMVFQNYALYPHMTVAQNMGYSLKLSGVPREERDIRVRQVADTLNLAGLLDRRPKQLSGGQRQRVAMGRAIVRDPKVFLFDEPLSNLDAKLRVAMRSEIKALHQKLKSTIIYVTHDQIEAMTMADRIVVMNQGLVEQVGTPLDLYDKPAGVFVASFIGSPAMNFFNAVVTSVAGKPVARLPGGVELPLGRPPEAAEGREILVGVRPEHFDIAGDASATVDAKIEVVEPTGSETHMNFRHGGNEFIAVFRERLSVRPGETLRLRPDPTKLHLFDRQSQQRLN